MTDATDKAGMLADNEVLFAIKRTEGYEDVHVEIMAHDFLKDGAEYRIISPSPSYEAGVRRDAERGRYMIANAAWHRTQDGTFLAVRVPSMTDLSCVATRENAIDALLPAGEKGGA